MMPLLMARRGETNKISAVHGKDEIKRFLANLGFVEGSAVTVISEIAPCVPWTSSDALMHLPPVYGADPASFCPGTVLRMR